MPKELLPKFGIYRLITTIIVLVQYFIIRQTKPGKISYFHSYFIAILVSGTIALMTIDLGGFNSSYYAGLNLVIIGVNLLLPWRAIHAAMTSLIIIIMYIGFNIISNTVFSISILANNMFFLCATGIIAVSINYVKHKLVKREFFLRVELKDARDALWSEMEIAKRIQTALLPSNNILNGFEIATKMSPAAEVGGDYYDIVETKSGEKWITIGDVSGHGVDSGLIMMMAQTSVISAINSIKDCKPSDVFLSANDTIRENIARMGSDHYMTMSVIHLSNSHLVFAGKHQDIIIYRSALNKTEVIPTQGTWLGITDEIDEYIEDHTVKLENNDIALFFTDGITEATNSQGDMFGQEHLEQALNEYADLPVNKLSDKIIKQVENFQQNQFDDMTLIVVKKCSDS